MSVVVLHVVSLKMQWFILHLNTRAPIQLYNACIAREFCWSWR